MFITLLTCLHLTGLKLHTRLYKSCTSIVISKNITLLCVTILKTLIICYIILSLKTPGTFTIMYATYPMCKAFNFCLKSPQFKFDSDYFIWTHYWIWSFLKLCKQKVQESYNYFVIVLCPPGWALYQCYGFSLYNTKEKYTCRCILWSKMVYGILQEMYACQESLSTFSVILIFCYDLPKIYTCTVLLLHRTR